MHMPLGVLQFFIDKSQFAYNNVVSITVRYDRNNTEYYVADHHFDALETALNHKAISTLKFTRGACRYYVKSIRLEDV